jgi:hypothetical protein
MKRLLFLICWPGLNLALAQSANFWSVPVSVQFNNNRSDLYFGVRPTATSGFDVGIDTLAPPPPFMPYAIFAIPVFPNALQADYRGAADSIVWSVRLLNTNGASSRVTWDTSRLRASGNARLVLNDTLNMFSKNATTFVGDQAVKIKSVGVIVSVKSSPITSVPTAFSLASYPNPFATTTTLEISLPVSRSAAAVRIFNLAGQEIRTFHQTPAAPGRMTIQWDGLDQLGVPVPSGVYFCRLEAGNVRVVRKLYRMR